LEFDSHKIPLDVRGENLNAKFVYQPSGPRYRGTISSRQLRVSSDRTLPLAFDFDTSLAVEKDRVQVASARFGLKDSSVELSGPVTNLASPRADFDVKAALSLAELGGPLKLPVSPQGAVDFQGKASISLASADYSLTGSATGSGLGFRNASVRLNGLAFRAGVEYTPARIVLSALSATGLGATFMGRAEVQNLSVFRIEGSVKDAPAAAAVQAVIPKPFPWAGIVSGPVKLAGVFAKSGIRSLRLDSSLAIVRGSGGIPIDGAIQVSYDQSAAAVRFGDSHISTPSSSLELSGTLGETLRVKARSSDLNDVLPVIGFVSAGPPKPLPVALHGGSAAFDGAVRGPLRSPTVSGQGNIAKFSLNGVNVDRASADFDLAASGVTLRSFELQQGPAVAAGKGNARLFNWQLEDRSPVEAALNVRSAQIESLLAQAGYKLPLSGIASATVNLSGSYGSPQANAQLEADQVVLYGERLGRVRAGIRYATRSAELTSLQFTLAQSTVELTGAYRWTGDWKNGSIQFHAAAQRLALAQVNAIAKTRPGLTGTLDLNASGSAQLASGILKPEELSGELALHDLSLDKRALGNLRIAATTHDATLRMTASGDVRKTKIDGSGSVRLSGDYQGEAKLQFAEMT
ncbi:MAG: hypothetical protein ACRD9L_15830, partial [Bryobacteraceae bacterium]